MGADELSTVRATRPPPRPRVLLADDHTRLREALLDEFDRWAYAEGVQLLEAPEDVKRYRKAYLAQVRGQLREAHG